ncbi:MAG: hypothetical protein VB858_05975 [Planctomycetaceae bacterium]
MRNMFALLLADDAGFVVSTELVLASTLLVVGITIGQVTLRDAVISEIADTASAINDINQSYSYTSVTGHSSSVAGSSFTDATDFCDPQADEGAQGAAGTGACINMSVAPTNE